MDKKLINRLFIIAQLGLALAAVIFLCIAIFGEDKGNGYLCAALANIILSNLFNLIRLQYTKEK